MPLALSLAKLSHAGEPPLDSRAARIKIGSYLAQQHGYDVGDGLVTVSAARSRGCAELAVINRLKSMLEDNTLESGTLLILDDTGSIPRKEFRNVVAAACALIMSGMRLLTIHDCKFWDSDTFDVGLFLIEVTLGYSDDRRAALENDAKEEEVD